MRTHDLPDALASALAEAGATTVFGMPGGGNNLDFIGAVERAGLRFVLAHAETPATIMAAVFGDLTETPGACVVTRGPGAASATNGVANALLDRQQLVMITDAVSAQDYDRIAHQRLDQRSLFAPLVKWGATLGAGEPGPTARQAVDVAMQHPRGPVHLDYDPAAESTPVPQAAPTTSSSGDLGRLLALVAGASRPVVLLGVGARHLAPRIRRLLEGSPAPVLQTYRAHGVVPSTWDCAAGLLTGATTEAPVLESADLIVMLGVDTVELIPAAWPYSAPVVSLASWSETSPYLAIEEEVVGDLGELLEQLAEIWPRTTWDHDAGQRFRLAEQTRFRAAVPEEPSAIVPQDLVLRTRAAAVPGTIATVDAGAHMLPAMTLWDVENVDEVLISSGLATMGFAVPAAVAAALARPGRRVVAFTGDGGLGMCLGELETIRRLDLDVTIVVFNDSRLSLIAIKASPEGNGGENAIGYGRTDFAAVAEGYGIAGERVHEPGQLDDALERALGRPGPSLVDVRVDPSAYRQVLAAVRGPRS